MNQSKLFELEHLIHLLWKKRASKILCDALMDFMENGDKL